MKTHDIIIIRIVSR